MTEVVVATKNPDKIPEIEAVLGAVLSDLVIVRGLDWPEVEETGSTLDENALLKARTAAKATGYPAIGDDTGLEVDALDGAPGVHTARFAGPAASYAENRAALLRALAGVDDRSARFRTAAAFVTPGGDEIVVTGELAGRIAESADQRVRELFALEIQEPRLIEMVRRLIDDNVLETRHSRPQAR